jgi:hypothetical protein
VSSSRAERRSLLSLDNCRFVLFIFLEFSLRFGVLNGKKDESADC